MVHEACTRRLLAPADVLVAPNTHGESFGIVLLEAMATHTAVVASELPALPRMLADGALRRPCPPEDPVGLARAGCRPLADPGGRERLVRRAAAAASAYDWRVLTPRVLDVYASVLARASEAAAG